MKYNTVIAPLQAPGSTGSAHTIYFRVGTATCHVHVQRKAPPKAPPSSGAAPCSATHLKTPDRATADLSVGWQPFQ